VNNDDAPANSLATHNQEERNTVALADSNHNNHTPGPRQNLIPTSPKKDEPRKSNL
jgi:hypothetical protein